MNLMRNRMLTVALLLAGGAGILAGPSTPAAVAAPQPPEILLGTDGVHYSTSLDADLFDGLGPLIPGQSQPVTLWVKNPTTSAAEIRLSATDVVVPWPDFATNVTLSAATSTGYTAPARALADLAGCEVIVGPQQLAAGESVALTLTFTLGDVADQVAQNAGASLNLRVSMRDAAAGAFPASACDDGGVIIGPAPVTDSVSTPISDGTLAHSGFDAGAALVAVGGLVGGGLLFFVRGRRRTRGHS